MFRKNLLAFSIFILLGKLVLGDNTNKIDSLEHALALSTNEVEKYGLTMALSDEYANLDIARSLKYAEDAIEISISLSDDVKKLNALLALARIYFFTSDLNKAMELALQAKDLAEELNMPVELAKSLDAIGVIYYDIGNHVKSSENFYKSLKIYEDINDKNGLGSTLCRIGTLYYDQKEYDKAVDFYTKSIDYAKEIKSDDGIASNLNNIAKVYHDKKDYDKSLQRYHEALNINLKSGNSYLVASNFLNIADVYFDLKQYDTAISNIEKARDIFEKIGNKLRLAKCQIQLSRIYQEIGRWQQSEKLAEETLEIAISFHFKEVIVSASELLNKLYLDHNDSVVAYKYYILENQYQDSLFLDEKEKTLTKLELQYQFDKNEQDLLLAKQRRNVVIAIISGCLFFSVIIILLIYNQLRLKARKLALEKSKHKQEIEFKNKEMVLNVMSLMKKNEMLAELSEKIVSIEKQTTSSESKETIKKIAIELQKSQAGEIWQEFSVRFKEVHGDFYQRLLHKFPGLTPNELKLCAFLRLNMTTKDISELTGQRVSSLETARYRLRQKLGIANSEQNLITFLASLERD